MVLDMFELDPYLWPLALQRAIYIVYGNVANFQIVKESRVMSR